VVKIRGIPIETLGTFSYTTASKQIIKVPIPASMVQASQKEEMLKRKRELEKEKEPEKKKGKGGLLGFGLIKKENFRLGNKGKNKEEEKKFKAEEEEKKDEGMNLVD